MASPPLVQASPQAESTTPPGNNTPLIQPASSSGAEDRSYTSAASTDLATRLFSFGPADTTADLNRWRLPSALYSYSIRMKSGGEDLTVLAPEFTYMDVLDGLELGIQELTAFVPGRTVTGPGLSLRYDLSPSRFEWVRSYHNFRQTVKHPTALAAHRDFMSSVGNEEMRKAHLRALDTFLDDFSGSARKIRISAFLTQQWLDGTSLSTGGLSVSQVIPTRKYTHTTEQVWGFVPRIALQELAQDRTSAQATAYRQPRSSRSVRTSLGFAFQDNIPHLVYRDPIGAKKGEKPDLYPGDVAIARWRFQAGAEYVFRNVTDTRESYGVYARFRNLKTYQETSLSLSRTPNKDLQFGLAITFTRP